MQFIHAREVGNKWAHATTCQEAVAGTITMSEGCWQQCMQSSNAFEHAAAWCIGIIIPEPMASQIDVIHISSTAWLHQVKPQLLVLKHSPY